MKKDPVTRPARSASGEAEAERRRDRLAAALRENLKKRKEQNRARTSGPIGRDGDDEV